MCVLSEIQWRRRRRWTMSTTNWICGCVVDTFRVYKSHILYLIWSIGHRHRLHSVRDATEIQWRKMINIMCKSDPHIGIGRRRCLNRYSFNFSQLNVGTHSHEPKKNEKNRSDERIGERERVAPQPDSKTTTNFNCEFDAVIRSHHLVYLVVNCVWIIIDIGTEPKRSYE